ncbi:MAG: hypothetical protein R3B90_16845 [Planctomycetaceae bacterium]
MFRKATLDRKFISQDLPVAIPEEGAELIVEQTSRNLRPLADAKSRQKSSDVIEIGEEDILDDE